MKFIKWMRTLASLLRVFFAFFQNNLQFSDLSRKRARLGLLITALILIFVAGGFRPMGFHPWLDPGLGIMFSAVLAFLGGAGFLLAFQVIQLIPRFFKDWGILLMGSVIIYLAFTFPTPIGMLFGLLLVVVECLFFSALFFWIYREHRTAGPRMTLWMGVALLSGLFLNGYTVYWLMDAGYDDYLVDASKTERTDAEPLQVESPAQRGTYEVEQITYGSGNTRLRPEYGEGADITTSTVDGSAFFEGGNRFKMTIREWLLGFDGEDLPLNAIVWQPVGDGPFPLVLMVHGNHNLAEHSDPGYAYLGRHLAGRGYIAATVDQNFFNGSFIGGLSNENDARAWVLLQHLKKWHKWNRCDTCYFYGKVDTGRIALIGHSRGGEAAAIAAGFNRLPYYPDDATIPFDFDFNIRSVAAIAPSDAQYSPAGKDNELKNISYLTLQGAHDADVSFFMGMRQYLRASPETPGTFKASVYSYRSNHGQFNTVWGNTDYGWPLSLFLNKKPLLEPSDQQKLAKTYITGFLEATLKEKREYMPMFRDHRRIGHWLPDDIYITRYEDHRFVPLCNYEEDVDVTTGSSPHVSIHASGLALWKENRQGFRGDWDKDNNVVTLGWRTDSLPADSLHKEKTEPPTGTLSASDDSSFYRIEVDPGFFEDHRLTDSSRLAFSAANTKEEVPEEAEQEDEQIHKDKEIQEHKGGQEDVGMQEETGIQDVLGTQEDVSTPEEEVEREDTGAKQQEEKPVQVDFTLRLADAEGDSVAIALSRFAWIPPVLESEFLKLRMANKRYGSKYEVTLQDFEIPLKRFAEKNPEFDPNAVRSISFVFNRTEQGVVVLDRIGIIP